MQRILLLFGALVLGCAPAPPASPPVPVTELTYDRAVEVDFTQMTRHERGFYWRDLVVGEGRRAQRGADVSIGYEVRLPDGTELDRAEAESPVTFKLGQRQGIVALESALLTMRVGGVRQLVVPPALGYGARGLGNVPPNATLVMIVRLVKVG